jgi:flagellar M-ring protein FliF
MLALEAAEADVNAEVRDEIAALVERQPEDVAALLRGWLVER